MNITERTLTSLSMSSLLAKITMQDIVDYGHLVLLSLDGAAIDIDIDSLEELRDYEKCPRCGAPHEFKMVQYPGGEFVAVDCITDECRTIRDDAQVERARNRRSESEKNKMQKPDFMKRFGIPSKYHHCSFDNFRNYEGFAGAIECVYEARDFAARRTGMMLITGNTGTGKTHLAIAIIRDIAERGETSIVFETIAEMISKFKETYHSDGGGKSEHEIIQEYAGIRMLALDDLGVENITPNSVSLIQQVIDERVSNARAATVVTSNFKPEKLEHIYGSRVKSRLTSGKHLHITAPDYRMKARKSP